MKKFITTVAFIALSTFSAKAIDLPAMPDLGIFSVTVGTAANSGVFGASATQTNNNDDGTQFSKMKEHGVFADGFQTGFVELGIGKHIAFGYDKALGDISTPENKSREDVGVRAGNLTKVSVDFKDLTTVYAKLNIPTTNVYVKVGRHDTTMDVKKSGGSASVYNDVETSGSSVGIGYAKSIRDTGFAIRVEGNYLEFDNVKSQSNGANTTAGGGNNIVDGSDLKGVVGKVGITYTFGG